LEDKFLKSFNGCYYFPGDPASGYATWCQTSVSFLKAFINVYKLKMLALKKLQTSNLLFTRVLGRVRRPEDKAVH